MGVVTDYQGKTIGWRGADGKIYRTEQEYKAQEKANRGKGTHTGLKNDRGLSLGDGQRIDLGDGKYGIKVPGGASSVKASGSLAGTASITLGGQRLFPMLQGEDAIYVPRGSSGVNTSSGERDAPKPDPNFVQPGINPRTGKPWTESPGKSSTEAGATLVPSSSAPTQPTAPTPYTPEMVDLTAQEVVAGFGNDFGSMKSTRLSDALRGAQVGIIQKRMDAGERFGQKEKGSAAITPGVKAAAEDNQRTESDMAAIMGGGLETVIDGNSETRVTPTTPQTTSNPANMQDGMSTIADLTDQQRQVDFPKYNPEEFKSNFMNTKLGSLVTDINTPGLRDQNFK